jgi:lysophospholipase L1-like esterase
MLRAAGAGAGTVGLVGFVLGAEMLAARRRVYLPETTYDRVLRFPGHDPDAGTTLRLAVLGDSTTTGVGTERVEETYAAIVGQALAERGPVEVHVLGRAAARISDVLATQVPLVHEIEPDLVLLVCGANDATHLTPYREVRQQIAEVLDGLSPTPVVLAGVPALDLAKVFAHPLREVSAQRGRLVNRMLRSAAMTREHVGFVSLAVRPTTETVELWEGYLAADRFHPSAVGYARWALELAPALLAADPRQPLPAPAPDHL